MGCHRCRLEQANPKSALPFSTTFENCATSDKSTSKETFTAADAKAFFINNCITTTNANVLAHFLCVANCSASLGDVGPGP